MPTTHTNGGGHYFVDITASEEPNAVHKSDGWSYRMVVGGSILKVVTVIKLTNYGGYSSLAVRSQSHSQI